MNPIDRAAEALAGSKYAAHAIDDARAALSAALDVDELAQAMADDWNPHRDPVLTAMFRDYASTVRVHLLKEDGNG